MIFLTAPMLLEKSCKVQKFFPLTVKARGKSWNNDFVFCSLTFPEIFQ